MRILILATTLLVGCGLFAKKTHTNSKVLPHKLIDIGNNEFQTPCINLHYIDNHYPEHIVELIRVKEPKVEPVGAYKIALSLLKKEDKYKTHKIDTDAIKICNQQGETGYIFKAVERPKN